MHAHELRDLGILRHGPGRRLPPKDGRMQNKKVSKSSATAGKHGFFLCYNYATSRIFFKLDGNGLDVSLQLVTLVLPKREHDCRLSNVS